MNHINKNHLLIIVVLLLSACSKPAATVQATPAEPPLTLISADILTLSNSELSRGPMISGTLQPVVKAELNAEVSAIVTKVNKDNGDTVAAGDLLVQLDQTTFRDKLVSAQEAQRSAALAADQANRQLKRMQQLRAQELVTAEVLETAEVRANQTQSDLASAKARTVEAQQQLERTLVRAPFAGVVAVRRVSAGDTAQVGKALMTLMDPASMRFEGYISADQVGAVHIGQSVNFRVNGYPGQQFTGEVTRINPQANEQTRQVQVFVSLHNTQQFVAGLYSEGYIAVDRQQALMLPPGALLREGDQTFVWQIKADKLVKQLVQIGSRDPRYGTIEVLSGVAIGDEILRHPQGQLKEGASITRTAAEPVALTASKSGS